MTERDLEFLRRCHRLGLIRGPLLDVGSMKVQGRSIQNVAEAVQGMGIKDCVGADLTPGPGVDVVFDFSVRSGELPDGVSRRFNTVTVFNVLEHTFDPYAVLSNAARCLMDGGTLMVVTPVVWSLHDFPRDYVRLLPHWYEEFANRENFRLVAEAFCWLSPFPIFTVNSLRTDTQYHLPTWNNVGRAVSPARYWVSRIAHRALNTFGRGAPFGHLALGVALTRSETAATSA